MGAKLSLEEIKEKYNSDIIEFIDIERRPYGNKGLYGTYVKYKCLVDDCKHEDWKCLNNVKKGSGCIKCGRKTTAQKLSFTNEQIIEQFKAIHGDKYLYDRVNYGGIDKNVWIGCKVNGHGYFEQTPSTHKAGGGCILCHRENISKSYSTPNGNSLSEMRPDLLKYLVNINDGNLFAVSSDKLISVKCPNCGKIKSRRVKVDQLSRWGFSCNYCSDGISIPEKFCRAILIQLKFNFESQKIFNWATDKRYDFYIHNRIIEVMGEQHYKETGRGRSLEEEQENDLLKYNLAIENGIKSENYIVIDARYSEFNWLKQNFIKSLEYHFDLSNIDWTKVWKDCQHSFTIDVCDYWNDRNKDENIKTLMNIFKLSRSTIINYLKRGNEIGLCKYDPKEESSKSGTINGKKNGKIVLQYSVDGTLIQSFPSAHEAFRQTGINYSSISKCCRDGSSYFKGFVWKYA